MEGNDEEKNKGTGDFTASALDQSNIQSQEDQEAKRAVELEILKRSFNRIAEESSMDFIDVGNKIKIIDSQYRNYASKLGPLETPNLSMVRGLKEQLERVEQSITINMANYQDELNSLVSKYGKLAESNATGIMGELNRAANDARKRCQSLINEILKFIQTKDYQNSKNLQELENNEKNKGTNKIKGIKNKVKKAKNFVKEATLLVTNPLWFFTKHWRITVVMVLILCMCAGVIMYSISMALNDPARSAEIVLNDPSLAQKCALQGTTDPAGCFESIYTNNVYDEILISNDPPESI